MIYSLFVCLFVKMSIHDAARNGNLEKVEEEIGDLLFSVVNLVRHLDLNPDIVVEKSIKKFKNRFLNIEKIVQKNNIKINSKNIHKLWKDAKIKEKLNNE